jgi:transglutaminase-like putative cysteine protease
MDAAGAAHRAVRWPGGYKEKARYLDAAATLDSFAPEIQRDAARIVAGFSTPLDALDRIHRWVRDRIKYVNDVGGEDFADSLAILRKRHDDCDGKSRLFCALVRAAALAVPGLRSLECRILPVLRKTPIGPAFVHVQGLARADGSSRHPLAEPGGWLLAELTLRGVPLGAGSEAGTKNEMTGRLDVS